MPEDKRPISTTVEISNQNLTYRNDTQCPIYNSRNFKSEFDGKGKNRKPVIYNSRNFKSEFDLIAFPA